MKLLRSIIMFVLIILVSLNLCGCIIIPLYKNYNIAVDEVVSIQFYDLRMVDDRDSFYYDMESIDPVFTVPEEEAGRFLNDFSKLIFKDTLIITIAAVDPSFSFGQWVVRINFTNGNYTFYSSAGYGLTMDAEGVRVSDTHYSCDEEQLALLIMKYYDYIP